VPLAEMIRITNSRLLHTRWSLNPPGKPMHLLCCCHRNNDTEDSTPPSGMINLAPGEDSGPPPNACYNGLAGSDDRQSSDCPQPEWPAAAAKRTTPSRMTRSGNTTKKSGRTHRRNWADVGKLVPESSGRQASVPRAKLGTRVLRSSRQGECEADLKKASRTLANNSGNHNLAVMEEADEPHGLEGSPEPQRKEAPQVGQSILALRGNSTQAMGSVI